MQPPSLCLLQLLVQGSVWFEGAAGGGSIPSLKLPESRSAFHCAVLTSGFGCGGLDERLRCLWAVGEIDKDRMLAAAAGIRNHVLCGMPRKVTQRRIVPNVAHR